MLQQAVDFLIYGILGLGSASRAAQAVNFFVYDSIKITLLLFAMISVMGFLRTYISPETIRKRLSGKGGPWSHLAASGFGAVTPFCSCSSIPIFMSFLRSGVPLGVTFSFLATSPIVNEYLVVLMLAFFGPWITILYVIIGMTIGTLCGIILGKMGLENHIREDMRVPCGCGCKGKGKNHEPKTMRERAKFGYAEAIGITKKMLPWILVAVAIGAAIHNYIPEEAIEAAVTGLGIAAVPIATLIGIPLYGNCAAIVPIAVALFNKGVPLGTALAFMMSTSALSLPEAMLLKRAMSWKLVAAFFTIVAISIITTGYAFNLMHL